MPYIAVLVFSATYMRSDMFVGLRLLDNLPLTEHSKWCIVSDASPHRARLMLRKSPIYVHTYAVCGLHYIVTRRPSLDVIERTERAVTISTSCNGGFRRGKIIATCAGEEPTYFRVPRRQVKTIFSRCTLAHCITVDIYARNRCS